MAYFDRQNHSPDKENQTAGFLLVVILLFIVGFLVFSIISSQRSASDNSYLPDPIYSSPLVAISSGTPKPTGESETPEESVSPSEEPSEDGTPEESPSPSPDETETAMESPSPTPDESPLPEEETPEPSPSPTPEKKPSPKPTLKPTSKPASQPAGERFESPAPDGPPGEDRAYGNMFEGKTGKAEILIFSKVFPAKSYMVDMDKKVYWVLEFKKTGQFKYKVEIPPGNYRLKIVKKYYFTFEQEFQVADGDVADINFEPLDKRPYLDLKSKPSGARIYINGKFAGVTPKVIAGLDETQYTVKLTKSGYPSQTFKVKLQRGKGVAKTINM